MVSRLHLLQRAASPEECGGAESYLARWRHWKYDFLCRWLRDRLGDTEQGFFTDDEDEDSHDTGYDPDYFDRKQVNVQLRRWAARGGQA